MNSNSLGTKTLDLLAQYDSHISERDKSIEYIEKKQNDSGSDDQPDYDDLFKENIKLKLQVQEYEAEIDSLKKVIEMLKKHSGNKPMDLVIEQIQSTTKDSDTTTKELVLPPRSADRKSNIKDLNLPIDEQLSHHTEENDTVPKINLHEPHLDKKETPVLSYSENNKNEDDHDSNIAHSTNPFFAPKPASINSFQSNHTQQSHLASPATSVTYTTSRITIKSPNKSLRSPVQERIGSPQNPNRVTSVINNQIRSPLRSNYEDREIDFTASPTQIIPDGKFVNNFNDINHIQESPVRYVNHNSEHNDNKLEFSPAAKARLSNFTELLESSFGENKDDDLNADDKERANNPDLNSLEKTSSSGTVHPLTKQLLTTPSASPSLNQLGSPVLLDRKTNGSIKTKNSLTSSLMQDTISENATDLHIKERSIAESTTLVNSHKTHDSLLSAPSLQVSKSENSSSGHRIVSNSTVKSAATSVISEIPLFVQPEDFGTIKIEIQSTLYQDQDINSDEYLILLSVIDRKSDKEMFKFSKSIQKIRELDVYLKSHVSSLSLPSLPERSFFQSIIPSKVALRREQLNTYFHSIFSVPEFPPNVSLKIAQFLSTGTVMNPMLMDDTIKEGTLMIRRPKKTLGNQTGWKLRYAVLNGDNLSLSEREQVMEVIRLKQCSIEIIPNLPDDKYGTKNGFLINEHKKSGLSSSAKYFICTETANERTSWITAINEFTDGQTIESHSHSSSTGSSTHWIGMPGAHNDPHRLMPTIKNGSSTNSIDQTFDGSGTSNDQQRSASTSNQNSRHTSATSSPRQPAELNTGVMEDKEARRLKMRSIFPFKKLNLNPVTSSTSATSPHIQNNESSSSSMNFEAVTVISQDSDSTPVEERGRDLPTDSQNTFQTSNSNVVFGSTLDSCLKLSSHVYQNNYELPSVVYRCLEYLYKNHGLREEGVFRLSGSSTLIKTLQEQFDKEYDIDLCEYENDPSNAYLGVNTVSGLLKLYLRNLPHLIFGDEQYLLFKKIVDEHYNNPQEISLGFKQLVENNEIPKSNLSLMYSLFELLNRVMDNKKYNKMNLRNLCIVFSPTLNIPIVMLQPFIVDFKCIFKGDEPTPNEEREQFDIHIPQL